MIPYREEKIKNAAIYFTREHLKRVKKPLYQTYLYKYLAFLDFCSIREIGMPALDLTCRAMERGPVPLEVYDGIGDASKITGVRQKKLRRWEEKHIPEPERIVCGDRAYRRYTQEQIDLIARIKKISGCRVYPVGGSSKGPRRNF